MQKIENYTNKCIAVLLIALTLWSCTMDISAPESMSDRILLERSSRVIGLYLDDIRSSLTEDELPGFEEALSKGFSSSDVASRTLLEENGRQYLEFILHAEDYENVDEVLAAGECLIDDPALLDQVKADIMELEQRMDDEAEIASRALTGKEKKEFYAQLRKLVVKAAVLLTAAIVYACVPKLMFWGKISAAAAIAVAAGILATTIMSIIEHYHTDTAGAKVSFDEWMADVVKEPAAAWAVASGMISTNIALGYSPVVTALIIGVFAIYNIVEDVKTLQGYGKK